MAETLKNRYKILIADDEPGIRELLQESLEKDYEVRSVDNGEEAFKHARESRPDLIILDVQMPVKDGLWACRELRTDDRTRHIPILILSSRTALEEKLAAYQVGADDYLEKPFTTSELRAKILTKLRRIDENRPKKLSMGNLTLHLDQVEVEIDGKKRALSVLENRLLGYFLQNREKVLPRRQILLDVWKDVNVSDRTVDAHIVSLRRKIQDFDHEIATVYGAGYALRPKTLS